MLANAVLVAVKHQIMQANIVLIVVKMSNHAGKCRSHRCKTTNYAGKCCSYRRKTTNYAGKCSHRCKTWNYAGKCSHCCKTWNYAGKCLEFHVMHSVLFDYPQKLSSLTQEEILFNLWPTCTPESPLSSPVFRFLWSPANMRLPVALIELVSGCVAAN